MYFAGSVVGTASDQKAGKERLQKRILLSLSRLPLQDIQDIQRPQVAKGLVSGKLVIISMLTGYLTQWLALGLRSKMSGVRFPVSPLL